LFGLAAKWKRNRPDRLTRLARAIEAVAERDRKLIEESAYVELLRARGAAELHGICRAFVDKVNGKLSDQALLLDPPSFPEGSFEDERNLFQLNLRGRLLQIEFSSTDELYEHDDFKLPYVLRGAVRSFNQDLLTDNTVDEQLIFYCPNADGAAWHYFDERTYRTGRVAEDYLITEMARVI
jgi:hypothetical protein